MSHIRRRIMPARNCQRGVPSPFSLRFALTLARPSLPSMASWVDGEADAAHLGMLVDELSLEVRGLLAFAACCSLTDTHACAPPCGVEHRPEGTVRRAEGPV